MADQHSVQRRPVETSTISPFAPWYPTGHCSVESSPGMTTLNGAPLPVGGVAAAAGLPTRIVASIAKTDKEAECFKGPPGALGKAKPKVT